MATPTGIAVAARQAASGYALRALPRRKTYTTSWDINTEPSERTSRASWNSWLLRPSDGRKTMRRGWGEGPATGRLPHSAPAAPVPRPS